MSRAAAIDLNHLAPEARSYALEDGEARIRRIRADRWIPFERGLEALKLLEELLEYPSRTCMPNLLIHGPSGMGKTMLSEKFRRDHPDRFDEAVGASITSVIFVEMPPSPSEGRFYSALLDSIGAPLEPRASLSHEETLAFRILPQIRPGMLMIDEVHHLLSGSYRQQRQSLNLIKSLGNRLRIPIVGFGTDDALRAIRTDPQIESRFWTFEIPRWREDHAFRSLLASIALVLPLRHPSPLAERAMVKLIHARTNGITREVFRLITSAAEAAIRSGSERIDEAIVEASAHATRRAA